MSNLARCLTPIENTLAVVANSTGLGEVRGLKTGTLGWTPLENVLGEVEAAPNQDTFAVAVDLCYMLAHPRLKNEIVNMWAHTVRGMSAAGEAYIGLQWRVLGRALQRTVVQ